MRPLPEILFVLSASALLVRWTWLRMWRTFPCYYAALAFTIIFTLLPNPRDPMLWQISWILTMVITSSLRWINGAEVLWLATLEMNEKEIRFLILAFTFLAAATILSGAAMTAEGIGMFAVVIEYMQLAAFFVLSMAALYLWARGLKLEPNTAWQLRMLIAQLGVRSLFAFSDPATGLLRLFPDQKTVLALDELSESLIYCAWIFVVKAPTRHWWTRRQPSERSFESACL